MKETLTKRPSLAVENYLEKFGGKNPYGAPVFRLIWGADRFEVCGARFVDRDNSGNALRATVEYRTVHRYPEIHRWYLEKWMPPEFFGSPEEWERRYSDNIDGQYIRQLGPYPAEGDYERVAAFGSEERYFEPTTSAMEQMLQALEASRQLDPFTRKRFFEKREELKAKAKRSEQLAYLDEVCPAFSGLPMVGYSKTDKRKGLIWTP